MNADLVNIAPVHLTSMAEDTPYPLWLLKGSDARIIWGNQEAERWIGQSIRAQISKSLKDYLSYPKDVCAAYARCVETESSVIIRNCDINLGNGQQARCHITIFPAGDNVGLMLQEAASQSDGTTANIDAMSAMGRMLAHEIKNPLAGISGAVQLLKPDVKGEEALGFLDLIGSEIERIRRLVDRMETLGDQSPERINEVNIHEVLHRAAKVMSTEKGRTVKFTEHYDPSLPTIIADEDTLMQALLNLIKNAVEAIEQSGTGSEIVLSTRFRAGVRRRRNGSDLVSSLPIEIQIQDDGPGIPEPIRAQIFQPFVSNKPAGQGLGLAVVSKIIKAHDGIIEVNSRPSKTIFSILLPLSHESQS